jgi:uncharacterized protein (UPF0276 family)
MRDRAAKEGSYSMLRMFIEFLGVKSDSGMTAGGTKESRRLVKAACPPDTLHIDAFSSFGAKELEPAEFGADGDLVARVHRTLCKINAHFTYDQDQREFYDRIASPDDETVWKRAVDIVVRKLDEYFYSAVSEDMVVHLDLERPFVEHYKNRLGLQSRVRGDGLGRLPRP